MKQVFNLRLPEELRDKIEKQAKDTQLSINQFITFILTKTITYNEAHSFLNEKLKKVNSSEYRSVLKKVPSRTPLYTEDGI